jgi:hypothetical protein
MAAIITNPFKKHMLQSIFDQAQIDSDGRLLGDSADAFFYIGIGRSRGWDSASDAVIPDPTNTAFSTRMAYAALQSVKKHEGCSFVVPRKNWSSGLIYPAFDDDITTLPTNGYYVLTEDNNVYVCLQTGKDANGVEVVSTIKPSGQTTTPFSTADGYVWKFLFQMTATRANSFLTSNFMPVQKELDMSTTIDAARKQQVTIQEAAVAGSIAGISVVNAGAGYSNGTHAVVIRGDGNTANATATAVSGGIVKVEMDSANAGGSGYNFASARVTAGSPTTEATLKPILSPPNGFGADPRDELRSTSLMFTIKPEGASAGVVGADDFVVSNDFRQIMLIKNPKSSANGNTFTGTTGRALRFIEITDSGDASNFSRDGRIEGATSGAVGHIDEIRANRLFFHQNDSSGFHDFQVGEALNTNQGTIKFITNDSDGIIRSGGEIFYYENRAPVFRDADQKEDIKVVITL